VLNKKSILRIKFICTSQTFLACKPSSVKTVKTVKTQLKLNVVSDVKRNKLFVDNQKKCKTNVVKS